MIFHARNLEAAKRQAERLNNAQAKNYDLRTAKIIAQNKRGAVKKWVKVSISQR